MAKSVCANYVTDQEMNFQNIQTTYIVQHKKKKTHKQPNGKIGRRPKQTYLWRRHTDGHQQEHEKVLNSAKY